MTLRERYVEKIKVDSWAKMQSGLNAQISDAFKYKVIASRFTVEIGTTNFKPGSCWGYYRDDKSEKALFELSWKPRSSMKLGMPIYSDRELTEMTQALSYIEGYKPFCRYIAKGGLLTVEWAKEEDEYPRWVELYREGVRKLTNLTNVIFPEPGAPENG